MLLADLAAAGLIALLFLVIGPGWAIVFVVALAVLVANLLWLGVAGLRSGRRRRR